MARRGTKIRQRDRGSFSPCAGARLASLSTQPQTLLKPLGPAKLEECQREAASSLPCGPRRMDQGLPLRKFKKLRELGEEKAKRIIWSCGWKFFPQLLWPNCVFSFLWIRGRVSQPQHYGYLGLDNSMLQRAVLCIIGCFTATPVFTYADNIPFLVVTTKNISRHCLLMSPRRQKSPSVEN